MIFDYFILNNTTSGFLNCLLCKWNTHFVRCNCCRIKNLVNLLLCIGGKDFLRLAHRLHLRFQRFHIVNKYRYNIFLLSHLDSLL